MALIINDFTGEATKVCNACGRELPVSEFYKTGGGDGYECSCKECKAKRAAEIRAQKKAGTYISKRLKFITDDGRTLVPLLSRASNEQLIEELKRRNALDVACSLSPREHMDALYKAGYRGKLTYTVTKTIELSNNISEV